MLTSFPIVLASQSPYRRQLLEEAGFLVEPFATGIPEPEPLELGDLHTGLAVLAVMKAGAARKAGKTGLILACDTVSYVNGAVVQKPVDRDDARRMLLAISDNSHEVLTGWCLLRTENELLVSGVETTRLRMRPWTEAEIEAYLDTGEWAGKCGGYGLQMPSDPFVVQMEGSAANVIGVPIERVRRVLAEIPTLVATPPRRA
jgi:septum formation protein